MGVENLWKLVKGDAVTRPWDDFKGQRVAVDAPNVIHAIARRHALALARDGDPSGLVRDTVSYFRQVQRQRGVALVLVFDGLDPPLKADEHVIRYAEKLKARVVPKAVLALKGEILAAGDAGNGADPKRRAAVVASLDAIAAKLCKGATSLSRYMPTLIEGIRVSLANQGTACCAELIVAPMEAEAQVAYLCRTGYVHAAWSGDSDLVMLRAPTIIHDTEKKNVEVLRHADDFSVAARATEARQRRGQKSAVAPLVAYGSDAALFALYCSCHRCDFVPFMPPLVPNPSAAHGEAKVLTHASAAVCTEPEGPERHTDKTKSQRGPQHPNGFQAALDAAGAHRSRGRVKAASSRIAQAVAAAIHQWVWDPVQRRVVHGFPLPSAAGAVGAGAAAGNAMPAPASLVPPGRDPARTVGVDADEAALDAALLAAYGGLLRGRASHADPTELGGGGDDEDDDSDEAALVDESPEVGATGCTDGDDDGDVVVLGDVPDEDGSSDEDDSDDPGDDDDDDDDAEAVAEAGGSGGVPMVRYTAPLPPEVPLCHAILGPRLSPAAAPLWVAGRLVAQVRAAVENQMAQSASFDVDTDPAAADAMAKLQDAIDHARHVEAAAADALRPDADASATRYQTRLPSLAEDPEVPDFNWQAAKRRLERWWLDNPAASPTADDDDGNSGAAPVASAGLRAPLPPPKASVANPGAFRWTCPVCDYTSVGHAAAAAHTETAKHEAILAIVAWRGFRQLPPQLTFVDPQAAKAAARDAKIRAKRQLSSCPYPANHAGPVELFCAGLPAGMAPHALREACLAAFPAARQVQPVVPRDADKAPFAFLTLRSLADATAILSGPTVSVAGLVVSCKWNSKLKPTPAAAPQQVWHGAGVMTALTGRFPSRQFGAVIQLLPDDGTGRKAFQKRIINGDCGTTIIGHKISAEMTDPRVFLEDGVSTFFCAATSRRPTARP